jgi:uncharacterized ion transporter superfamily protein YfcC
MEKKASESSPCFRSVLLTYLVLLCVVLLCVYTFLVPCGDVRCDVRINNRLCSNELRILGTFDIEVSIVASPHVSSIKGQNSTTTQPPLSSMVANC